MTDGRGVYVATVAGMPVPLAWVDERLDELRRGRLGRQLAPVGPDVERVRRWIVQEVVDRVVEQHEARAAGLMDGSTPATEAAGSEPGRPWLPAAVAERLFERVTAGVTVQEQDVRGYYERNTDLYERPEARRIRYAIASSGPGARAALDARYELLTVHRGELSGPLGDAVFRAAVGDVVGPLPFGEGWMAARVEAVTAASTASFEEVRATIEAELLRTAKARAYEDWITARRAALAVIEPAFEHPGHPIHGLPTHRH